MSLLDDFETLEQKQVNSIDYYLRQMVIKDRFPIVMDFDVFCQEYFQLTNRSLRYDPDERLYSHSYSNLIEGRVYIAAGIDRSNVTQLASEYRVIIGTIDGGLRKITEDELEQYIQFYKEQWPDCDYIYKLEQTLQNMRWGRVDAYWDAYKGYSTIAIDDPNKGFNFEMIY